jgi:predicted RND superfamily exporter protein
VVIRSPRGWLDPAVWGPVDSVADALAAEPAVAHVLSPLDVLRQVHYWTHGRDPARYRLPADAAEARELVDTFDPLGGGERSGLVADGGHALRLSALLRVMPASEFLAVRDAARRALAALPAPLDGEVTGLVLQLVDAQLDLVASQLRSFAAAFVTVFLCIAVGLRSLRAMLVSILPNLLPVLAALAAMALVGIPLDPATVMMASVALGIAVDDTVHVLSAFARARRAGDAVREAVGTALAEVRPALVVTTVAACIGFLALGLSDFVPIRCFGLLSALALAVALAADLLVLPALLVRGAR